MSEVRILDKIVVDEPQNVEIAIYNLIGKRVEFSLIRKFILNEKNTIFYLDKKLNSSTDSGYYNDYVWLDTGFRDENNSPIMICLHNQFSDYVGHYTGTIRELSKRVKSFNKKNVKDIDKNYSRFVCKYKSKAEERINTFISDTEEYAIQLINQESVIGQETELAMAMRDAGIEIVEIVEELIEEEPVQQEEELSEEEKEITVGLLLEQMENMQNYIDQLLIRIENQEKTSKEEIEILKAQNQEYKRAIVNIRLFNQENAAAQESSVEKNANGHNLLGKNEKILVLGNTDIRVAEMRAIARDCYGFEKADFEFITDYEKIKTAGNRIHGSNRFAAVIFGNCPHKVAGMGNYSSLIDEFKNRENCPISIDARNEAGGLKITKQSFRNALNQVCRELKSQKVA